MVKSVMSSIYQALDRDACSEAIVLLREVFPKIKEHSYPSIVRHVASLGDEYRNDEDFPKAEETYKLGLALYEKCFYTSHAESLPCLYGLLETLRVQCKEQELENTLNRGYLIIRRLAKAWHHRPHTI